MHSPGYLNSTSSSLPYLEATPSISFYSTSVRPAAADVFPLGHSATKPRHHHPGADFNGGASKTESGFTSSVL
jgi:hypothetical protein